MRRNRRQRSEKMLRRAKQSQKVREFNRLNTDEIPIPLLPRRRKTIIVIDHDFGTKIDIYTLDRTNRIDCYWPSKNGTAIGRRMGMNAIGRLIATDNLPILSPVNL